MKKRSVALLCATMAFTGLSSTAMADTNQLQQAIDGKHRQAKNVMRDEYRNPLKTLELFDIQPHHTVVEIWPSGGWYTEILAPYLKDKGKFIAAHYDSEDKQSSYRATSRSNFEKKMAANPDVYGKVKTTSLMIDEKTGEIVKSPAKSNSVDRIVTFRSSHGLYKNQILDDALAHYFDMLKSGGKLGFVQHQADETQDWQSKNIGYISRSYVVSAAAKAGFQLEAEGYFNNNPLDTKRWEGGVWQLPPGYRGSKTDEQRAPYKAIGESDRMTLVFVKP